MNQQPAGGALQGATLYIDCFSGIAGDMMLAALIDLGVPESVVREALGRLDLPSWELKVFETMKGALRARKVEVIELGEPGPEHATYHDHREHHHEEHTHEHRAQEHHAHEHHAHEHHDHAHHDHAHEHHEHHAHDHHEHAHHSHDSAHERSPSGAVVQHVHGKHGHAHIHYAQIRALINKAGLDPDVRARAQQMFERIARVEAHQHGVPIEEVAFHEVGALDSIVDIVGVAAALAWLRPARVVSRSVAVGGGMVWTAHGRLPVPAPATLALLTSCGAPIETGGPGAAPFELTTPTGAAILAACVSDWGGLPAMRGIAVGHGAGTRELPDRPNLLRLVAGVEPAAVPGRAPLERCTVIEANIDDMNPQLYEPLLDGLLAAGARDVWLTPVHMKKGRPGVIVGVLCDPGDRQALATRLLRESTTLGVRMHEVERLVLDRSQTWVTTPWGAVPVKVGREPRSGEVWNVAPEYEPCRELARTAGVPLKEVLAAALLAYHQKP